MITIESVDRAIGKAMLTENTDLLHDLRMLRLKLVNDEVPTPVSKVVLRSETLGMATSAPILFTAVLGFFCAVFILFGLALAKDVLPEAIKMVGISLAVTLNLTLLKLFILDPRLISARRDIRLEFISMLKSHRKDSEACHIIQLASKQIL